VSETEREKERKRERRRGKKRNRVRFCVHVFVCVHERETGIMKLKVLGMLKTVV